MKSSSGNGNQNSFLDQDTFLNQLRKKSIYVTIYLITGYKLRGIIKSFDSFTIFLEGESKERKKVQQMIYKHAISTFEVSEPVNPLVRKDKKKAMDGKN